MSAKKLILLKDGEIEKELPLKEGQIFIGRSDDLDLFLDNPSISRKHACIHYQYGSVYIENLSMSGGIKKNDESIEYSEIKEGEEVKLGPYSIYWSQGIAESSESASEELFEGGEIPDDDDDIEAIDDENVNIDLKEPEDEIRFEDVNATDEEPEIGKLGQIKEDDKEAEKQDGGFSDNDLFSDQNSDVVDSNDNSVNIEFSSDDKEEDEESDNSSSIKFDLQDSNEDQSQADFQNNENSSATNESQVTGGSTQVFSADTVGVLKIIKGEESGREIRLDHGVLWIVGRSPKCHARVHNKKLSRQHFKIVRIGQSYRLQDLGSANGTRLNGVAINDSPLQAFDTINAGDCEFKFLIADANLPAIPEENNFSAKNNIHDQSTKFSAPAVIQQVDLNHFQSSEPKSEVYNANFAQSKAAVDTQNKPLPKVGKPIGRIILYSAFALLLAGFFAMEFLPQGSSFPVPKTPDSVAQIPKSGPGNLEVEEAAEDSSEDLGSVNAAEEKDIDPAFLAMSPSARKNIEELYAKAERAYSQEDWKTAAEAANEILSIGRYKNATQILAEAQTQFNDKALGTLSGLVLKTREAKERNDEQVILYLDAGQKALEEQRWEDAKESFVKAINLDPKNEEANKGFEAAVAQNTGYSAAPLPTEVPVDPDAELRIQINADFESQKAEYQEAEYKERQGRYNDALSLYIDLRKKLSSKIDEYQSPNRYPASLGSEFHSKARSLYADVNGRINEIYLQYESMFRSQLIDAEQYANNSDFNRSREIYDRILNEAPDFHTAEKKRERLYLKIISKAKSIYHEALIYESVGDVENAVDNYVKTKDLLSNIQNTIALEYYKKANSKLKGLTF